MADEQLAARTELPEPTRRTLLRGAAVVGVAGLSGVGLAACGGDETTAGGGAAATATGAPPPAAATPPETAAGGTGGTGGLAKTSDIPVGGGKVFGTEKIVITQPAAGQFKAFSAVCTHQNCTVSSVSAGVISCACHGSKYSATDGSVRNGPAQRPLAEKKVTVTGEDITVA